MKKRKLVLSRETIRPLDAHALGMVAAASAADHQTCVPTSTRLSNASQPADLCGYIVQSIACNFRTTGGELSG